MTFSTEKNKVFKLWNDSIENQFQIDDLSSNDKLIFNKITNLNKSTTVYNNIIDLSSEWLDPDIRIHVGRDPVDINIFNMFKQFEIAFNGIHKNLIPYIESKIIYRVGEEDISLPIPTNPLNDPPTPFDEDNNFEFKYNNFVEIEATVDELRSNVIYKTSVFFQDGTNTTLDPNIQFKFFITITNPNYFQST